MRLAATFALLLPHWLQEAGVAALPAQEEQATSSSELTPLAAGEQGGSPSCRRPGIQRQSSSTA